MGRIILLHRGRRLCQMGDGLCTVGIFEELVLSADFVIFTVCCRCCGDCLIMGISLFLNIMFPPPFSSSLEVFLKTRAFSSPSPGHLVEGGHQPLHKVRGSGIPREVVWHNSANKNKLGGKKNARRICQTGLRTPSWSRSTGWSGKGGEETEENCCKISFFMSNW